MVEQLKPAPIARPPRGLLSFLGLRTGGRNPRFLGDTVAPVINVESWMEQSDTEQFAPGGAITPGAIGGFDFSTLSGVIPQTEGRWTLNYYVVCSVPAGSAVEFYPCVFIRTAGGGRVAFPVGPVAASRQNVDAEIVLGGASGRFFMPPDSCYGAVVKWQSGAGPFNFSHAFRYNSFLL